MSPAGAEEAKSGAEALLSRLRELRARGRLCDVLLTAGGDGQAGRQVAHQAVLAAVSKVFRGYLIEAGAAEAGADEAAKLGLSPPPKPQELRIEGLADPGRAFDAAVRFVYGPLPGEPPAALADFPKLAAAWGLPASGVLAEDVLAGLRELRARGTLCDIVLAVGGRRFVAHQAVLAAASEPLRRYIMDKLRELVEEASASSRLFSAGEQPPSVVDSRAVVLSLEGVAQGDALRIVLDFIYGKLRPGAVPLLASAAVLQDVRQLAVSLELPLLQAAAARWSVKAPAAPLPSSWPGQPPQAAKPAPSDAAPPEDAGGDEEAEDEEEEEEEEGEAAEADGGETDEAGQLIDDKTTELERALYALRHMRFDSEDAVPSSSTLTEEPRMGRDVRMLERLREAFRERAVWLETALLRRLPASADETTLTRLLPFVAYQWIDGPWQKGYTRLGWDPRECPEEAAPLQVLQFRDPHWQAGDEQKPVDHTFRRPPSQKTQCYQLTDLMDDFVTSLIGSCDLQDECCKKSGWLAPFIFDALRDRLSLRSQMLRERLAAKAAAEKASVKAAGRGQKRRGAAPGRGRGGGRAKKTRTGGG